MAQATRPNLVLLDISMPGMDGMDAARALARLPHPPRVVFVTAHEHFAVAAFDVQAVDYLVKPVAAERHALGEGHVVVRLRRRPPGAIVALPPDPGAAAPAVELAMAPGAVTGFLRFDDLVQEVFDVAVLPGKRFPEVCEPGDPHVASSYVLP